MVCVLIDSLSLPTFEYALASVIKSSKVNIVDRQGTREQSSRIPENF